MNNTTPSKKTSDYSLQDARNESLQILKAMIIFKKKLYKFPLYTKKDDKLKINIRIRRLFQAILYHSNEALEIMEKIQKEKSDFPKGFEFSKIFLFDLSELRKLEPFDHNALEKINKQEDYLPNIVSEWKEIYKEVLNFPIRNERKSDLLTINEKKKNDPYKELKNKAVNYGYNIAKQTKEKNKRLKTVSRTIANDAVSKYLPELSGEKRVKMIDNVRNTIKQRLIQKS